MKTESNPKVDPKSLHEWVVGFCIIRFDLEQGQVIEECYPPGCLTQDEEMGIAYSSFPDSVSQQHNRSSIHDCIFFFRFHRRGNAGGEYLYGYVFNRQRQDERLKRGGEQKSVVIVSCRPYSNVFRPLLQIMAPLYFDIGKKALELTAAYVSSWPPPVLVPGQLTELPIGNASLKVYPAPNEGLFHDSDLFGVFRGAHLLHLWLLWELVLVGEPLLVIAPTPPQCCEAVATLVSLIAPLFSSLDFRPYFTIHDPEFSALNSLQNGDPFPPMLLGVTNLFFLKALRTLPHVVSVGTPSPNSSRAAAPAGNHFSPSNLLNAVKLRRQGPLSLMTQHKEAIWTTYSPTTKPDTSILNRLVDAGVSPRIEESMSVVNNEILRRHFLELTTNFLAPFGPYFKPTTPSQGCSPFIDPPPLPEFNADDFLAILATRGPGKFLSKRMKSNWLHLYRRFLQGPNFVPWFRRKRAVTEQEQQRVWRQARMKIDIQPFISKMSELDMVDSFHAVERHIEDLQKSEVDNSENSRVCEKLKRDLQAVFNVLPKDMQELLLMRPERATLLK